MVPNGSMIVTTKEQAGVDAKCPPESTHLPSMTLWRMEFLWALPKLAVNIGHKATTLRSATKICTAFGESTEDHPLRPPIQARALPCFSRRKVFWCRKPLRARSAVCLSQWALQKGYTVVLLDLMSVGAARWLRFQKASGHLAHRCTATAALTVCTLSLQSLLQHLVTLPSVHDRHHDVAVPSLNNSKT